MIARLGLGSTSSVVELASNDGYLCTLHRPRHPLAGHRSGPQRRRRREARGVPTLELFARPRRDAPPRTRAADLVIGNNVPPGAGPQRLRGGIATLLGPSRGDARVPHLVRLVEGVPFAHLPRALSYFSLTTITRIGGAARPVVASRGADDPRRIAAGPPPPRRDGARRAARRPPAREEAGGTPPGRLRGFEERCASPAGLLTFLIESDERALVAGNGTREGNTRSTTVASAPISSTTRRRNP